MMVHCAHFQDGTFLINYRILSRKKKINLLASCHSAGLELAVSDVIGVLLVRPCHATGAHDLASWYKAP